MSSMVAQALRESHCGKRDADHPCAGTLTISARGVCLDCPLCGKDALEGSAAKHFGGDAFEALADGLYETYMQEFAIGLLGELGGES